MNNANNTHSDALNHAFEELMEVHAQASAALISYKINNKQFLATLEAAGATPDVATMLFGVTCQAIAAATK